MKLLKNIISAFYKFDISPIGNGSLHKYAMYLLWGLNVSFFLVPDFDKFSDINSAHSINTCYDYIKHKKNDFKDIADLTHLIESENISLFAITSSCNYISGYHDVISNAIVRGPPHISTL